MTPRATGQAAPLPNPLPRPADELDRLKAVWKPPSGWRLLSAVNNTHIGFLYIGTALIFLVLAGVLALLMRVQLAVPDNTLLDQSTYNQVFTMHGTVMMFLFAVPVVEAVAIYLLPGMLGARDLPFPRLSAYAFWAYAIGGLAFFCTIFFGVSPDGGWFMYPPLTSYQYSPGTNADWWLLGIGFIEISAIAGAIELIVGILRTRAPGMSLGRMPIFAWAMLVVGVMIVFAFPSVIAATTLLELERTFHWPFFIAEKGGDPVLWQHLFWFFGHPEVYIIFLPAAGMVSMIVPAMAQTPLVGYRLVVLALLSVGFFSFALWAHHMFATGMPTLSMSIFSAASMAVAIPSAIQVFSWLATLGRGKLQIKAPSLFILGFVFTFVLGGLTGVMVAALPFDWQAHDTYFIVAHLHYVLIGGMVFPLFAAFYFWAPLVSGKPLSERLARWVFWLMFGGFNLAFFPMHFTGLMGMPRRVYTYPAELGWGALNMLSTIGAFIFAAGVVLFLIDAIRNVRMAGKVDTNPWNAGTLEWLPQDNHATRSVPRVISRYPLWDQPGLREQVDRGQHYLPGAATGERETLVTSPVNARPQYLLLLPSYGWPPFIAAAGTAAFFLLLTVKMIALAAIGGITAVVMIIVWLWGTDRGPAYPPVAIGDGITLPVSQSGPRSHSWWGMVVLLIVDGATFLSLLFSYFYLWTLSDGPWPPAASLPDEHWSVAAAALWLASSAAIVFASRLVRGRPSKGGLSLLLVSAVLLATAACAVDFFSQQQAGLAPTRHAFDAIVATIVAYLIFHAIVLTLMAGYTVARAWRGLLHAGRRATMDSTMLLWHYNTGQAIVALVAIHWLPRLIG